MIYANNSIYSIMKLESEQNVCKYDNKINSTREVKSSYNRDYIWSSTNEQTIYKISKTNKKINA